MKSRRFTLTPMVFAATLLFALPHPSFAYTLDDALANARSRPSVVAAAQAQTVSQADFARTRADPFALKLDRALAQQAFTLSEVKAAEAYYAALSEIGSAYANQLQAVLEQRAALANEALSRRQASVARIRFSRGSITQVEVDEAEAVLGVATAGREASDKALTFARNALGALLPVNDSVGQLEPIPDEAVARALPDIDAVLSATAKTSALLSLQQEASLARISASLLDPSYSSVREIDAADTVLKTATAVYLETTRTLFAEVRTLYAETSAAQELFQAQQASAAAAQTRLLLQRQRFGRGLLSDLELKQAEFDAMSAQLEMTRAKTTFVTSLLELQATSALPLASFAETPARALTPPAPETTSPENAEDVESEDGTP